MATYNAFQLLKIAKEQVKYSYSPYSNFAVGAALLGKDGNIYTGCNVENAAYGACICAERTAVVKAVSRGCREFTAIAIVSGKGGITVPCGTCRQFLAEFSPDLTIILEDASGKPITHKLTELLPNSFKL
ncbi:MAG: cytidine deaminase [Ruminococcus sp.]|jgi:cytidine deaminase|nr:cytidine deaminase [Ruminococcus sp.]